MTNILSLGIVYDDSFGKPEELKILIDCLIKLEGELYKFKVSKDLEGENWVEGLLHGDVNKLNYKLITDNFYGEINIRFKNFWGIKELPLLIRFIEEKGFFGFLLEFDLDILKKFFSLDEIDELLIKFSKNHYTSTKYKYVFCDHDSEVEYPPIDYKEYVKAYSLVIIPKGTADFSVIKNKWHLDGFTSRTLN